MRLGLAAVLRVVQPHPAGRWQQKWQQRDRTTTRPGSPPLLPVTRSWHPTR